MRGRIRLLRGLVFEEEEVEGWYWLAGCVIGKEVEGLVDEMGRRLVESGGWMLDLVAAGSWIPSLLNQSRSHRQHGCEQVQEVQADP